MKISKIMNEALLKLYSSSKCIGYVQLKTSSALESRGLIYVSDDQQTGGDSFPMYKCQLTANGYDYCLKNIYQLK